MCQRTLLKRQTSAKAVKAVSTPSASRHEVIGMREMDHRMKGIKCVWILTNVFSISGSNAVVDGDNVRNSLWKLNRDKTINGHFSKGIKLQCTISKE